ncbi:sugar ABC transporter substrate-binding protein [uncultured Paenibacillus sp.]|uniref:ABC transporter substrate-binding protein n=2 Tax=Paenibacillus TaxID=44249 RepID=UPI0028D087D5|nr:sugar ABC transporter substrate-binding protein [uncultured Paenibacillus sp.]
MRRFLTRGLVFALALMLVLAGCGNGGKPAETAAGSGGASPSSDGGKAASGETSKVSMVYWPGPESDAMQKVVDAYNAGQGKSDGVEVEMVLLSRDGTYEKEAAMMNSKSDEVDMYFTASYIIGQHAPYLDSLNGKVKFDNYLKSSVDSLTMNGEPLAVPMDVSNHFMFYRTDLIEKLLTDSAWQSKYKEVSRKVLGKELTPKDPKEWSWDDFIASAAFFSKEYNEDSPTKYGTALQLKNLIFNIMIWDDVLYSNGGSWLDDQGNPQFTSDAAKKAMDIYRTVYEGKMTSPNSTVAEYPETQAALQSGNAAFAMQWGAAYGELNDPARSPEVAGKISVAPIPGKQKTHVHSLGVALNKYAKNKDGALKWMNYLTTVEAMNIYAENGGIPPISEVLNGKKDKNAVLPLIAEHVDKYGYSVPILAETQPILQKLAEALSGAWVGQEDTDKALAKAQQEVSKLLNK